MLHEIKLGLQRYWRWTSTGPKWHWAAGIGGPILAFLIFIGFVGAVSGDPKKYSRDSTPVRQVDAPATESPTATPRPTATAEPTATPVDQALVVRVIDGDTIEVDRAGGRINLRYIRIDTPESVAAGQPVACFALEATNRNKELVEGKTVLLEKDVSETDQFGRLLRYVYLEDGRMVNELLVVGASPRPAPSRRTLSTRPVSRQLNRRHAKPVGGYGGQPVSQHRPQSRRLRHLRQPQRSRRFLPLQHVAIAVRPTLQSASRHPRQT